MKEFYIIKNQNYVTISNFALRDKNLSLKAKGLYAFMLSLPEGWDFTVSGLVAVLREGRDAILSALKELEENSYLHRFRVRRENGTFSNTCYVFYEQPLTKVGKSYVGNSDTKNTIINDSKRIKEKKFNKKSIHFANERSYSEEELNALYDDIETIRF